MFQVFSTGQVARLMGVQPYQIEYAHATGQIVEPSVRFLGKRVYAPDDVRRVARHFGVTLDEHIMNNNREEDMCGSSTST